MKIEVLMPKMGESVNDGTILKWLKKKGDKVEKDEILFEISTDKVDTEIPSSVSGFLSEIKVFEQETVNVGTVVAIIETDVSGVADDNSFDSSSENSENEVENENFEQSEIKNDIKGVKSNRFYSPLVLKIASEENVSMNEIEKIIGTGLDSRVTKKDILGYIELRKISPKPSEIKKEESITPVLYETHLPDKNYEPLSKDRIEVIEMDKMRQIIMQNMEKSRDSAVHVMGVQEVDMSRIEKFMLFNKDSFHAREGIKLTYMPFIVSATIRALKDYPFINASIDGKNIIKKNYFNIGIAVALEPMGLIVPVIKNADEKNLIGIAKSIYDLGTRARNKKLLPDEIKDSTFTITNYGVFGTLFGNPIINQPEVAILGIGSVTKKPVVVSVEDQDTIAIKPMMYLSLSHDHRLVDGALAGKFLTRIKEYLENFDARII